MVQTILGAGGGAHGPPLIKIHYIERTVHGNGIGLKVYGEIKCFSNVRVYARELKLNTLDVLKLTPMGSGQAYAANKYIVDKGEYDNYASIHVYDQANNPIDHTNRGAESDGSIWLDFDAKGE